MVKENRYKKRTKKQKANVLIKKIKYDLFYVKKATDKLMIKNNKAIDMFFEMENIKFDGFGKIDFLLSLHESKKYPVLNNRCFRPRKRSSRNEYLNYLQSKEWQEVRKRVFTERGRKCERCGKDLENKIADVHHKTYENLFNEKMEDLEVLCRPCHQDEHKDKRHSRDKKKISFEKRCEMLKTTKGRRKLRKSGYKVTGAK